MQAEEVHQIVRIQESFILHVVEQIVVEYSAPLEQVSPQSFYSRIMDTATSYKTALPSFRMG